MMFCIGIVCYGCKSEEETRNSLTRRIACTLTILSSEKATLIQLHALLFVSCLRFVFGADGVYSGKVKVRSRKSIKLWWNMYGERMHRTRNVYSASGSYYCEGRELFVKRVQAKETRGEGLVGL